MVTNIDFNSTHRVYTTFSFSNTTALNCKHFKIKQHNDQ